jgi:hypothetical protein
MKQTNNTAGLPVELVTFIKPFGQSRKLNKVLLKDLFIYLFILKIPYSDI